MAEGERPFLEELLDVAVFAPIGVLTGLASDFPAHVARGRREIEKRLATARVTGRFAVTIARRRFDAYTASPEEELTATDPAASVTGAVATEDVPPAENLAIPDYDALAASQVVARLDGLRPDERDAIRRYESATRGRRTILGRLQQLDETE